MTLINTLSLLGFLVGALSQTLESSTSSNCSIHDEFEGNQVDGYQVTFYNISDLGKAVLHNFSLEEIDQILGSGCDVNYHDSVMIILTLPNNDNGGYDYGGNYYGGSDYGGSDYGGYDYGGYDDGGYDYGGYDYGGFDYGGYDYGGNDYGGYDYGGNYYGGDNGDGNSGSQEQMIKGTTALHLAVLEENKDIVAKLITVPGIELDMETNQGITPLQQALYSGFTEIMEELVIAGANIEHTDIRNFTLLHHAVFTTKNLPAVELFLKHDAEIDAQTSDGWTALHLAVVSSNPAMTELLLDNGADSSIKDNLGMSAEMYAAFAAEGALQYLFKSE